MKTRRTWLAIASFSVLLFAPILTSYLAQGAETVSNNVRWIPTRCDTIRTADNIFRWIGFEVVNEDSSLTICKFSATAIDVGAPSPDSCDVIACGSPGGTEWLCYPDGYWHFSSAGSSGCIGPGETLGIFTFSSFEDPCCYLMTAFGDNQEVIAVGTLCNPCDDLVPTLEDRWGELKVRYR